jgi:hypothetical protein
VIRRPVFPIPAGMALLARPDAAPLPRALTTGKGIARLMAGWRLAACVCLAARATRALSGVATDSVAHDKIIHVVIVGFTMLMITATAIALAASGAQAWTVFCS